jgi:hypothetical protein
VYIWKTEQTPKPPLDRTVVSKSATGVIAPQKTTSQESDVPTAEPELENTNGVEEENGVTLLNPPAATTSPSAIPGDLASLDTQTGSMAS